MSAWKLQYSTGDQGENKKKFWEQKFKTCQIESCKSNEIDILQDSCGCRMNGDAYGVYVFTCKKCGWKTSFHYDDASDNYFYETDIWRKK